jgi:hypothetical protein
LALEQREKALLEQDEADALLSKKLAEQKNFSWILICATTKGKMII